MKATPEAGNSLFFRILGGSMLASPMKMNLQNPRPALVVRPGRIRVACFFASLRPMLATVASTSLSGSGGYFACSIAGIPRASPLPSFRAQSKTPARALCIFVIPLSFGVSLGPTGWTGNGGQGERVVQ